MEGKVAAGVGVAGSVAVLCVLVAPYALLSGSGSGPGLGVYYGAGAVGVGVVGFLALLEVVVLLAGARGRTDPPTAAGIAVVVGVAMVLLAVAWALAVPRDLVFSFPAAWLGWHRWAVVAVTLVVPAASAAYARSVLGRE
ncbi:MAG: hypothetical protein ABEJ61_07425 [Haloferacaceae archaeon]